jgi:hypothetical protein
MRPVFRQLDVTPARLEKRHPDFFFQLVYRHRQRGLDNAQVARALRYVFGAGDFQKVPEVGQFHGVFPLAFANP